MARSRSGAGSRSASFASSRPRPAAAPSAGSRGSPGSARSGSSWFGGSPSNAPPPAPRASAPPPAVSQGAGGGVFSGLMGNIMTGAAIGTGSAFAHRAVDSVMGPREMQVMHEQAPAQVSPAPAPPASSGSDRDPCSYSAREFAECMSRSNGDLTPCSAYFDAMQNCRARA